ncbi:Ribosome biogenesis protein WDR12 -like protein [Halotydeus destructor]|nr:Ribosome biogenesis protein WDR12 -like protein [Halotydeus destructor]
MSSEAMVTDNDQATGRRYDVRFLTKQEEYAVPSTVYQIDGSSSLEELNKLINALLNETNDDWTEADFDFIVGGQLLRLALEEHLEELSKERGGVVSAEKEIEIEYLTKEKAPTPSNSLLHDDWVSAIDANGDYVLSGSYDGVINIWTLSGKHKIAIPGHKFPVKSVRWIDTSRIPATSALPPVLDDEYLFLSGSHEELVNVWKWNAKTNKVDVVFTCRGHCRSVDAIDVNCDLFASGSFDKLLKIWSLEIDVEDTGEGNGPSSKRRKKVKSTVIDEEIDLKWNKTKVPLITLSGHNEAITGIVWLANTEDTDTAPEIATCSMDNTIRLWDIEVSESKQTLVSSKALLSISYCPSNNLLLTGSCDRHIRLWDPRCTEGSMVKQTFSSHHQWVSSVAWSPKSDIHFISGSYDQTVKYWDIRSPKASLYDLIGHKDKVLCVNWSNPEYMISGSADNQLKIFKA